MPQMEQTHLHLDTLQLVVVVVDLLVVQTQTLVDLVAVDQVKMLMALVVLEPLDKVIQVATTIAVVAEAVAVKVLLDKEEI